MIEFFTDPILRAPTWGCILMCVASSMMGVLIFLKKRSLVAEALSHAAYPGACLAVALFALLFSKYEEWSFIAVLIGALFSSLLGLKAINWLEEKGKVRLDAALCFILALFFGIGVVIVSIMQSAIPVWYRQVQMLLFGQAATMSDIHIYLYAGIAALIAVFLILAFHPIKAIFFDRNFSLSAKIPVIWIERIVFWLLLLSLIVGIRSVGVVLMSGMFIAPAVAARSFSNRLHVILGLASLFGASSAFFGNYLSVEMDLPTGPMIVLIASFFALFGLFFSPKRGLCFRLVRIVCFRLRCIEENILKGIWKKGEAQRQKSPIFQMALWRLKKGGWLDSKLQLTSDGKRRASMIVRLHRLWELYLTEELGFHAEKVHRTAEEMEHILTPEMEEKLTRLLENPKKDPHQQPIPQRLS